MAPLSRCIAGLDVHRMLYVLAPCASNKTTGQSKNSYALFTHRQAYCDRGIDYQAIAVNRNASSQIQALKKYGFWPKVGTVIASIPAPAR